MYRVFHDVETLDTFHAAEVLYQVEEYRLRQFSNYVYNISCSNFGLFIL